VAQQHPEADRYCQHRRRVSPHLPYHLPSNLIDSGASPDLCLFTQVGEALASLVEVPSARARISAAARARERLRSSATASATSVASRDQ
jgi:hypothetical protein